MNNVQHIYKNKLLVGNIYKIIETILKKIKKIMCIIMT